MQGMCSLINLIQPNYIPMTMDLKSDLKFFDICSYALLHFFPTTGDKGYNKEEEGARNGMGLSLRAEVRALCYVAMSSPPQTSVHTSVPEGACEGSSFSCVRQ